MVTLTAHENDELQGLKHSYKLIKHGLAAHIQDDRLLSETSNSLLLVDGPPMHLHPKMLNN